MTSLRYVTSFILLCLLLMTGCSSSPDRDLLHWNEMGGPHGRDVSVLLVDRETPETVYAGIRNGTVCRSTDEGSSWSLLATVAPGATISMLVQHPDDSRRIFACTDRGLYVSSDAGGTWSPLRMTSDSRQPACKAVAFDPYNPLTLYAGVQGGGIVRSGDGGATWQAANGGNQAVAAGTPVTILIDPSHPDNILAALSGVGIIRSGNGGRSWQRLTPEFSPTGSSPTTLVVHRTNPGLMVYATDAGSIFRSTDGGQNWRNVKSGLEGDRISRIVASPNAPEELYAGSEYGVLHSTDFGATWSALTFHLPAIPTDVAVSHTSSTLYLFSEGMGVRRSKDGGATWQPADMGLAGSTVTRLATDASGNRLFAVVGRTVALWTSSSNGWSTAGPGLRGTAVTSLAVDNNAAATLFAATSLGIFASSDDAASWQDAGRTAMSPGFVDQHPIIPTRVFCSGERGLFVSTDRGTTWRECMPHGNRYQVNSLTFLPTDAGNVHGATVASGILSSSDGGLQWRASSQGLPSVPFIAVTVDRNNPLVCYAWSATGEGFRSMNGGLGWSHHDTPWLSGDSVKVAYDKLQPWSMVVLSGSRKLYYSDNAGGTWISAGLSPLPAPVISLAWNASNRMLYIGTLHEGIFQIPLGEWLRKRLGD